MRIIQLDDYIRATDTGLVGCVLSYGTVSKLAIPGFWVRLANGNEDFIAEDDAQLLGGDIE